MSEHAHHEATFKHKVVFRSKTLKGTEVVKENTEKIVTIKQLDQGDTSQHRLHFMIMSLYRKKVSINGDDKETRMEMDSDALYDITYRAIQILFVTDEYFTEIDLAELLADSMAILRFGLWFLETHVVPFIAASNL